jgi:hypothetical protein
MNPYGISNEGLEFIESAGAAMEAEAQNYHNMNELNLMGATQEEMSATSILSLFDTTKEQRKGFIQQVIESVLNGYKNPLDIQVQIKCLEEIIKGVSGNEDYRDALATEAAKHGKGSFEFHNASIILKNAPAKWDYSQTNDSKLFEMKREAEQLKENISQREKFLQTIPAGGMADPDTGDIIYKAATPAGGTVVAVTLK